MSPSFGIEGVIGKTPPSDGPIRNGSRTDMPVSWMHPGLVRCPPAPSHPGERHSLAAACARDGGRQSKQARKAHHLKSNPGGRHRRSPTNPICQRPGPMTETHSRPAVETITGKAQKKVFDERVADRSRSSSVEAHPLPAGIDRA